MPPGLSRRHLLALAPLAWAGAVIAGAASPRNSGNVVPTFGAAPQPGLVLAPGPEGWWDSWRVSGPSVMRGADGIWRMWYYGRDASFDRQILLPTGRCGLATSADGVHWERVRGPLTMGAVFEPSPDPGRFDLAHVGVSDVGVFDGLYWMWYFGGDQTVVATSEFTAKGLQMRPGCAVSRDGINWVRLDGPYRGAMLDVGPAGAFDALTCAWPKVVRDKSGWKLYYHSLSDGHFHTGLATSIGLATSRDGLRWEKAGLLLGPGKPGSFDERAVGTRHVLRINGEYVMFYEGVDGAGYHSIGLALSDDGIRWRRDGEGDSGLPVLSPAPKGSGLWDARAIGTPCVVPMQDGSFRMYYVGASEGGLDQASYQIGLAVSEGSDFRRWRRWGQS